jgi:carbamoyltransferase
LALAKRLKKITGKENLCYAGGVALNCVANSKIVKEKIFKNVYIPPDPGDGGGAMGAALYGSLIRDKMARPQPISCYLGKEYKSEDLQAMIPFISTKDWAHSSKVKMIPLKNENIKSFRIENRQELISFVAKKIFENKIIGWLQGRFENGPRALGNRSILCRPDSIETAKRLSSKVKMRAPFRPYACSLTREEAKNIFVENTELQLEKWMQSSFTIKNEHVLKLRAAAHVDCSTRAQVVDEMDNEIYFALLNEYKKLSGHAALLNTSFNENGSPLVSSPTDAFIMFARTDLDIIVIDNYVLEKAYETI